MSSISLELIPSTLETTSRIPSELDRYYVAQITALIHDLRIDHPKDKSLGVDLSAYQGSWCNVYIEKQDQNRVHPNGDHPVDTCALLHHHPDGDDNGQHDYGPDWRFNVWLALSDTEYLAFQSAMNQKPQTVLLECHSSWDRDAEESLNFPGAPDVWVARFNSFTLKYCARPTDRRRFIPVVSKKFQPFKDKRRKDLPQLARSSDYYLQEALSRWAMTAPVRRKKVEEETDEAVGILEGLVDTSADAIGHAASEYLKRPWATCGVFEIALFTALAHDRTDHLISEIKSGENYIDAAIIRAYYGIPSKVQAPATQQSKHAGIWILFWGITLGVAVGIGVGWAAGLAVAAVFLTLQQILLELKQRKTEIIDRGDAELIHDLEKAKNCVGGSWFTLCPHSIRERFERLESRGVDWHSGTLELVRHAEARNPNAWE
jgi:hypothetical protein